MSSVAPAIGIDLGTTCSCVAVVRFGKVEVIANNFGNRITPSMVAFDNGKKLVGDAAKQQAYANYENTVFDAKRLIGCKFSEKVVQEGIQNYPFKIIDDDGTPKFQVTKDGSKVNFSPVEISALVLGEIKKIAEDFLGKKVKSAVITVPAYFNDLQRQDTMRAAEMAKLEVLRIVNEPTAACVAFGYLNEQHDGKTVLVYDFGGGTFDVSVVKLNKPLFEVLATGGNTHLGGEDIDRKMVKHCIDDILRKHKVDITSNKKALGKLRRACELAKKTLSAQSVAHVQVESLYDGTDYKLTISRAKFDDLNANLFESTIKLVESTLADANVSKSDIDEVVLVGGSTRIPKIQKMVYDLFGKEPVKSINPDEAVGQGAAIIAATLSGNTSDEITKTILQDVTPLSLGIEVREEIMSIILERNTKVPAKHTKRYHTVHDNQKRISVSVYQGESTDVSENAFLGKFVITGIPPGPARSEKHDVTFDLDENGILNVSSVLLSTKEQMKMRIEMK